MKVLVVITRGDGTEEREEFDAEPLIERDKWEISFPPGLTLGNGDSFQIFYP